MGWKALKEKYGIKHHEPSFPLPLTAVLDPASGKKVFRFWAGVRLPVRDWMPAIRRGTALRSSTSDRLRHALQQIADGHNDPRQLAKHVLDRS